MLLKICVCWVERFSGLDPLTLPIVHTHH